ncbi:hypothetical protein EVAR_83379_1 [Eumeta japonica]|uniref:Uncharacterized protein n=1 Tax=Eumeta variegata TaxID=151549 RepID=A0A4C1TYH3_EUMVA|nr:hypothetical protein EVAR_83379_1 [Eumeta japonica]
MIARLLYSVDVQHDPNNERGRDGRRRRRLSLTLVRQLSRRVRAGAPRPSIKIRKLASESSNSAVGVMGGRLPPRPEVRGNH